MALLACEGGDSYTANNQMVNRWPLSGSSATYNATDGRFGGKGWTPGIASNLVYSLKTSVVTGSKIRMGRYFKCNGAPLSDTDIAKAYSSGSSGGPMNWIKVAANTGVVKVMRMNLGSTLLGQGSINVCDNQWHWIEFEITLTTGATGTVKVYIDEVLDINLSSVQTMSSTNDQPVIAVSEYGGTTYSSDDVVIWDNQGSVFDTFPIGPQQISTFLPTADSTPLQFTPNSGTTHYTQLDDGWTTTNYVQDGTSGKQDMFTSGSLSYSPANIRAVVTNIWAQNPGTATIALQAKISDGTNTSSGTSRTLGSGGVNGLYSDFFYVKPAGGSWAPTDVNSLRFGFAN